MRGGVGGELPLVVAAADDEALGVEHDRADGDVAVTGGQRRLLERERHRLLVRHRR